MSSSMSFLSPKIRSSILTGYYIGRESHLPNGRKRRSTGIIAGTIAPVSHHLIQRIFEEKYQSS